MQWHLSVLYNHCIIFIAAITCKQYSDDVVGQDEGVWKCFIYWG